MKRTLVADDVSDICDTLHIVLEDGGYRVESVSDGSALLARLHIKSEPAVVLLDALMPTSARDVLRAVRTEPLLPYANRFVVMTAAAPAEVRLSDDLTSLLVTPVLEKSSRRTDCSRPWPVRQQPYRARTRMMMPTVIGMMSPKPGHSRALRRSGTVFSTPSCPWCARLKARLRKHKVAFRDGDVSRDSAAAQQMVWRSGQMGVPQAWIDGQVVVGFDRPRVDALLGLPSPVA